MCVCVDYIRVDGWLADGCAGAGGFQLLHAVYAVECFLANLRKRKCNFHLVFFEGTICAPLDLDSPSI